MRLWKRILFLVLFVPACAGARSFTVAVYNVHNLHDLDDVAAYDEFQPERYPRAHALTKLRNITRVVEAFDGGRGPDVLLLNEIEIDHTPGKRPPDYDALLKRYAGTTIDRMLGEGFDRRIADLPAEALLLKAFAERGLTDYRVVAGSDGRDGTFAEGRPSQAVKCVVFSRFPVKSVREYPLTSARNILEVALDVDGHVLTVFNNHWKSGAGEIEFERLRVEAAGVLRRRIDELLKADPYADIVIGGDLNSHYNQKRRYRRIGETGINDVLGSQGNELAVRGPARDLYNLWFELPEKERGSDVYRGEWGTLMHLIVSRGLYDQRGVQYVDNSFGVLRIPGVNADAAGLPVRWNPNAGPEGAGFSDHLPLYAKFTTVDDNAPGKFLPLARESGKEDEAADAVVNKVNLANVDFASAIVLADLPVGANLRDGTWNGKLFRVEADAMDDRLLKVEFRGQVYDVYGPRREIRDLLYAQRRENKGRLRFYGELGTYKGNWQFLVKAKDWVK